MSHSALFTFKIGGQAGQGIKSAGLILAKVATRSGYGIFNHTEYPSLVRGGHNVMSVTVAAGKVAAPTQQTNFLVALDQETVKRHAAELPENGFLLFDAGSSMNTEGLGTNLHLCPVPLLKTAREIGNDLLTNTVALGAALALLGGKLEILQQLLAEEFADKKPIVVTQNQTAAEKGFNFAHDQFGKFALQILTPRPEIAPQIIVNGNDAIAMGAIAAGMQFAAIYPMTPISNIMHNLTPWQQKYRFIFKQPEDEIAGINMAIGASFAGARSLVATSGGGFCLMAEGYGLAGMTETPLVIIEGMRPGPATGLPTWSEQGDLRFVLHAHQGNFPKIILAPGDPEEAFRFTMEAFNLADIYQTPVVVLVDKNICEDDQSFPPFDISGYKLDRGEFSGGVRENYQRYALTENGISLRAIPGHDTFILANSDEHDETGFSTEEAEMRRKQMDKRMQKLETCRKRDLFSPILYGPKEAETTIISWGSNKGSILEALKVLDGVNYLHITSASPFPATTVKEQLSKAKHLINIENNFTAQMGGLIREKTGLEITDNFLKYDGRPIYPEEIINKVQNG